MNASIATLNDDQGGRVCRQCGTQDDGYVTTLLAYSAYTSRDVVRGDTLFLAAQTLNGEFVTVEFPRVPYRLFLNPDAVGLICVDELYGENLKLAITRHAELRACTRRVDSLSGQYRDVVEVRFRTRALYTDVYQILKAKGVPVFIDGAHDALQGLDALLNLGIPGATVSIRLRPSAGFQLDQSRWRINSPADVCVHEVSPSRPFNLAEVAIGLGPDRSICVGDHNRVAWFGEAEAKIFERHLTKIRPRVIVVRDKPNTMRRLQEYTGSFFANLFSVSPLCPPKLPSHNMPLVHGLGVLIFDVATLPGATLEARPCQWLDAYRSQKCMEDRWMQASTSHTNTNYQPTPYETFTATMVLHYASNGMVCEMNDSAHAPYEGGHLISPRTSYLLQKPVAVFDFKSHYPSIARTINAGKDTYVARDGQWDLGRFGGFVTERQGSLAVALKEQLEERMRIVDNPVMQKRANILKQKINQMVGMCGHRSHPYADTRVVGCITATGRRLLQACHRHVSDITLAGYTDSLFLELPSPAFSSDGCDPLTSWLSTPTIKDYESRFKMIIGTEMQSMTSSPLNREETFIRFQCQQITVATLFTAAAHAHAIGYLTADVHDGNPRVDIQIKGVLKSPVMKCVRLFNDALVSISIAGAFLIGGQEEFWLGDIRDLEKSLPTQILTSTGWKTAVRIESSFGQNGVLHAFIHFKDGSGSRHCFLPRAHGEGLVEVTHITSPVDASGCLTRRRESCLLMTELFFSRLCRSRLPLDAYAIDRANGVLVRPSHGKSKQVPLSEAARNGLPIDLMEYHRRWMRACIDPLICPCCRSPLENSSESCFVGKDTEGNGLFHKSCNPAGQPLDQVPTSILSSYIRTALSAVLVSGYENAAEAVSCLIGLRDKLKSMPVKEDPPSRPYSQVIADMKKKAVEFKTSKEYIGPGSAFACIPNTKGTWLCIDSDKISTDVLRLLHEAMRVHVMHGRYDNDTAVLEAVSEYPADRLRFAPPPILKGEGQAPIQAWQEVINGLAKTPEKPILTRAAPFKCQVCETVFHLGIGNCGHIACTFCSLAWKKCATCKSAWKMSCFDKSPRMNYHPSVFPFREWYEYLPVTGWYVYRGPDELVYDSSARRIIALATGEAFDGK